MLFRMLHVGHPLLGRRELQFANLADPAVMRRLYGAEARFVFDPADDSNRPLPEKHGPVLGHWAIYPQFLRELFTRAFTAGLYDPSSRVQESEWRRAMRLLHDSVLTCPGCGAQSFHDPARGAAARAALACWHCGRALPATPPRLGLRRRSTSGGEGPDHVIVIEAGACVFADQLGLAHLPPQAVAAEVTKPRGQPLPCLSNLSGVPWTAVDHAGSRVVPPGGEIGLAPGLRLHLGEVDGTVRA
jgi:hypothetical protein